LRTKLASEKNPILYWNEMSVPERVKLCKSIGLKGIMGSKAWGAFTYTESETIKRQLIKNERSEQWRKENVKPKKEKE